MTKNKSGPETWLMSKEEFHKYARTVRISQQVGYFHQHQRSVYYYHVYVDPNTLEVFNPYTKANEGRKYELFHCGGVGYWNAKQNAFQWIIKKAQENGLYDPSICDTEIKNRQLSYLQV